MGCVFEWFGTIATILLALQLLRKVFPWIYENFVGPKLNGALQLKKFGKWASKYSVQSTTVLSDICNSA